MLSVFFIHYISYLTGLLRMDCVEGTEGKDGLGLLGVIFLIFFIHFGDVEWRRDHFHIHSFLLWGVGRSDPLPLVPSPLSDL